MTSSTLSSWALLVWEELQARQLNANEIFRLAGLNPGQLSDSLARYPVQKMAKLWDSAWQASKDDNFGITTGAHWNPTSFHALGFAWLASSSLSDAFTRFVRYGRFINDGASYELVAENMHYRVIITPLMELNEKNSRGITVSYDAAIVALLKMCRLLLNESFSPTAIYKPGPPTGSTLALEKISRCAIHFGHQAIELLIDRKDMEKKLSTGNSELTQINDAVIIKHLAQLSKSDLANQVQQKILELLPSGQVNEQDIAKALGLSARTMQRRLAEEKVRYSHLLQNTRKQLAQQYIANNQLAISEIAYLLGFSDQANFTRAFKRWTEQSPTQYRKQANAL